MGRPSVKAQRAEEILEAFGKCVCKYGIEGATLERISEESGLARPLIRHHMGNREDLVESLFERFIDEANEMIEKLTRDLPANGRVDALLQRLFDDWESDWELVLLAEAFIASSGTRPEMADTLGKWVNDYTKAIARELRKDFSKSSSEEVNAVATGVIGIFFNASSLEPLKKIRKLRVLSKEACFKLIGTLS